MPKLNIGSNLIRSVVKRKRNGVHDDLYKRKKVKVHAAVTNIPSRIFLCLSGKSEW